MLVDCDIVCGNFYIVVELSMLCMVFELVFVVKVKIIYFVFIKVMRWVLFKLGWGKEIFWYRIKCKYVLKIFVCVKGIYWRELVCLVLLDVCLWLVFIEVRILLFFYRDWVGLDYFFWWLYFKGWFLGFWERNFWNVEDKF